MLSYYPVLKIKVLDYCIIDSHMHDIMRIDANNHEINSFRCVYINSVIVIVYIDARHDCELLNTEINKLSRTIHGQLKRMYTSECSKLTSTKI